MISNPIILIIGRPFRIFPQKIVFQFFIKGSLLKNSANVRIAKSHQNATSYGDQLKH